ncbi:hypothetical protein TRVA0_001S08900 [Trichomonascus vanleenenianus]|uniref:uncharacterized protein n=1 Tax=Trichomonascus vanleenenianus TaxID=2268995 RepID=UPI003EC9C3B8
MGKKAVKKKIKGKKAKKVAKQAREVKADVSDLPEVKWVDDDDAEASDHPDYKWVDANTYIDYVKQAENYTDCFGRDDDGDEDEDEDDDEGEEEEGSEEEPMIHSAGFARMMNTIAFPKGIQRIKNERLMLEVFGQVLAKKRELEKKGTAEAQQSPVPGPPTKSDKSVFEDAIDIDALYKEHVSDKGMSNDHIEISVAEMAELRASYMTDPENMLTRYRVGQAMSGLQFEDGFKTLKEFLDAGELRQILSDFYYHYVTNEKDKSNVRVDLNELFDTAVAQTLPDVMVKSEPQKEKAVAPEEDSNSLEEDSEQLSLEQGDMEIGLYGWGHYLRPELRRKQMMKELVFWYKLKLLSSRVAGTIQGVQDIVG